MARPGDEEYILAPRLAQRVNTNVAAQGAEPGCLAGARHRPAYRYFAYTSHHMFSMAGLNSPSNELSLFSDLPLRTGQAVNLLNLHVSNPIICASPNFLNTVAVHFRIRRRSARHPRQPLSDTSKGFGVFTYTTPGL